MHTQIFLLSYKYIQTNIIHLQVNMYIPFIFKNKKWPKNDIL